MTTDKKLEKNRQLKLNHHHTLVGSLIVFINLIISVFWSKVSQKSYAPPPPPPFSVSEVLPGMRIVFRGRTSTPCVGYCKGLLASATRRTSTGVCDLRRHVHMHTEHEAATATYSHTHNRIKGHKLQWEGFALWKYKMTCYEFCRS